MISFFGLKRERVIGTKLWPNEPVPPVTRMVELFNTNSFLPNLAQLQLSGDRADLEFVRGQNILVIAIGMDELVLQREMRELARGAVIPGQLLDPRAEAAARHMLFQHDHVIEPLEGFDDTVL